MRNNPQYAHLFHIFPEVRQFGHKYLIRAGTPTKALNAALVNWVLAEANNAAGAHDSA